MDILAEFFFPGLRNIQTFIRRNQVNFLAAVGYFFHSDGLGGVGQDFFKQIGHGVYVPIRLVQLHHGKFGVMCGVYALVAEHVADFVNAVKAAYNQALVVQFQRDAQAQRHFQRVVIRLERARNRAAAVGREDGRFHFQKSFFVQRFAYGGNDVGAFDKNIFYVFIGD